ncbi:MAG: VPLPA-CTERM sorting domain-containing protein [Paracoccaceae bacterium]
MKLKNLFAASATAICLSSAAFASTLGFAVTDEGVLTPAAAGPTASAAEQAALLGAASASGTTASASDIIGFFIPLDTTPTDVVVAFEGVDGGSSFLNVFFEDLDLIGANDPVGFFEQVVISSDSNVLATITDIDQLGIFGDASTQQTASIDIGNLTAGSNYWATFTFSTTVDFGGTNTSEFLIAEVGSNPANVPPVPLPAAGWMLLAGLGGLIGMRRKKAA